MDCWRLEVNGLIHGSALVVQAGQPKFPSSICQSLFPVRFEPGLRRNPGGALRVYHVSDDHFKELVRDRTDIVGLISESVTLQSRHGGREFAGLCPFHDDHNPSMMVYPDRKSFKCWSCQTGGDCFAFVMEREKISFLQALEMLAKRAHLEMPRSPRPQNSEESSENKNRLYEIVAWAENEFHECLLKAPAGERARRYLADRGISGLSISQFKLGYHPDNWQWLLDKARGRYTPQQLALVKLAGERDGNNGYFDYFVDRVMFPIRDAQQRPVAFGGRILPDSKQSEMGKYWNSVENLLFKKSQMLYALDHARDSISKSKTAVVVEGYTDCIMAHQHGLTNFVATLGTALNESHVTNLKRFAQRVVLVFDGDTPGKLASEKALPKFLAQEIDLRILTLPDNLDPAEFLVQRGRDQLIPILEGAVEAWEQKFRLTIERYSQDTIDANHRILSDMLEVLSQVPVQAGSGLAGSWQMRENVILGKLSHRLKISETHVRERLSELRTAHQQKNGTGTSTPLISDDAKSQQSGRWIFPRNPSRDEQAERELLEVLFTLPEHIVRIRAEISPAELTVPHFRELLEVCFQMQDQGIVASYERVTARLEDACLKNLAADIDRHARRIKMSSELAENTLQYFRNRRELRQKEAAVLAGPHRVGVVDRVTAPTTSAPTSASEASESVDQIERERLRLATELHRKRVSRTTQK
jgi:DNA primase